MRSNRALVLLLFAAGAVQHWRYRHFMYPDGQHYLDLARLLWSGDASALANLYWSPAYPVLIAAVIGPVLDQPYWWYPVVQLANAICYAAALWQFHKLLIAIRAARPEAATTPAVDSFTLAAYGAFAVFVMYGLNVRTMSPDMLVAAVMLAIARRAMMSSAARTSTSTREAVILGLLCAFGYYVKAVMLPVALLFLAVWAIAAARRRLAITAAVTCLAASAPLIIATSVRAGRLTFGESGRLNYAWYVNEQPYLPDSLRACDAAPVYRWSYPAEVTYAPSFEAPYFRRDEAVPLSLANHGPAAARVGRELTDIASDVVLPLVPALALLLAAGGIRATALRRYSALLLLSGTGLVVYLPVHVETRFIAAPLLLTTVALLAAASPQRLGALPAVAALMWLGAGVAAAPTALGAVRQTLLDVRDGESRAASESWRVAQALAAAGVAPGSRIGVVGDGFSWNWAQLARVTIVSQAVVSDAEARDGTMSRAAVECLSRTGVAAIVGPAASLPASAVPLAASGLRLLRLDN